MRHQLSQPSFVNGFARSKGESVRPDLWSNHLWCPSLGNQGSTLYDVAGRKNGAITNGVWSADGLAFAGDGNVDCGLLHSELSQITIIIKATTPASTNALIAKWNTATSERSYAIYRDATGLRFAVSANGAYDANYVVSTTTYPEGVAVYAMSWGAGTKTAAYINGVLVGTSAASCPNMKSSAQVTRIAGFTNDIYTYTGTIHSCSIYDKKLNSSQILALSADPLLPIRRKKIWSMYVPSTGGVFKPFWCQKSTIIGAA